jgi:hypothetical protein
MSLNPARHPALQTAGVVGQRHGRSFLIRWHLANDAVILIDRRSLECAHRFCQQPIRRLYRGQLQFGRSGARRADIWKKIYDKWFESADCDLRAKSEPTHGELGITGYRRTRAGASATLRQKLSSAAPRAHSATHTQDARACECRWNYFPAKGTNRTAADIVPAESRI